jgi:hypothetical protein
MRRIGLLMLLIMTIVVVGAPLNSVYAQDDPTVRLMLLNYYNAINQRNYSAAYNLWNNPAQTYQNFSAGFTDTAQIVPYFGSFQPGAAAGMRVGRIPVVLSAYHTDNTLVSYYGCITAIYLNPTTVGWRIVDGDLRLLFNDNFPDNDTITQYLVLNCYDLTNTIQPIYDPAVNTGPHLMLKDYYDLINRKDYANAYNWWLKPLPGPKPNGAPAQDYRLPYSDFVNGYIDTAYVNIYFGNYVQTVASAGHSYLDGLMPAVLIGQQTDGSVVSYYGCYVVGRLGVSQLGIVSGGFVPLTIGYLPDSTTILQALKLDCTQQNLQY